MAVPYATRRGLTIIRCIPKGLCSWDFILEGEDHHASLEFNWIGEQGTITADGISFEVNKHGMFSGHWTLLQAGQLIASAQKTSLFTRTFNITNEQESLVVSAASAFGRGFRVDRSGVVIATIKPDHGFTRRATIEILAQDWDFRTIAFAFWLVVITWRRDASDGG